MIERLFLLICGHALADFSLQTDVMAKLKNWKNTPDWIPDGQKYVPCWHYWMLSHSLIHGGIVYLITGNILFGFIETISHFGIDSLKCANKTNPNQDQFLHIACKIIYLGG